MAITESDIFLHAHAETFSESTGDRDTFGFCAFLVSKTSISCTVLSIIRTFSESVCVDL